MWEWRNDRHWRKDRFTDKKAGVRWATLHLMEGTIMQHINSAARLLCTVMYRDSLCRVAFSGCSHLEEEIFLASDKLFNLHKHLYLNQRKAFPFLWAAERKTLPSPWIWGFGILDMALPVSTIYIHSGLHLFQQFHPVTTNIQKLQLFFILTTECF